VWRDGKKQDLAVTVGRLDADKTAEAASPRNEKADTGKLGLAVRPSKEGLVVEKVEDVAVWQSVVKGPVTPAIADADFAAKAAELLPPEPWNAETWSAWTNAVKTATGRKGKELFMPLRQALTASDHGPELKLLLPLIGRERALKRLKGETA